MNEVVTSAKVERELESLMKKQQDKSFKTRQLLHRHHYGQFLNQDMFFEIPGGPDVVFEL